MHRTDRERSSFIGAVVAGLMIIVWGLQPALAQSSQPDVTEIARELERSFLAIEDGERDAPRDRWDPQYVVDQVGIEPEALFDWVRSNVAWVPYRGMLRGAVGVLMDRRGNSLDIALLLDALMTAAGYETRLAHAELADDQVDGLWARLLAPPEPEEEEGDVEAAVNGDMDPGEFEDMPDPDADGAEFGPAVVASDYGLDPAAVETTLGEGDEGATDLGVELGERVSDQVERLAGLIGPADGGLALDLQEIEALDALSDHWWLQFNQNGDWLDLDPLEPDGVVGASLALPETTIAADALPPELAHRVMLRVVTERWVDGATSEGVVLQHELTPADLIGQRIVLYHMPMVWPADWPATTPDDIQTRLRAAVLTQREWLPILTVGEEQFIQFSMRDNGEVNEKPNPQNPFASIGIPQAGEVGKVIDLFDAFEREALDGEAPPPEPVAPDADAPRPEGELTAEWLEFEIRVPGQPVRIVRREVFDLIGAAERMAGALDPPRIGDEERLARSMAALSESEIMILPAAPSPDYVVHKAAAGVLANRALLEELSGDPFGKAPANVVEILSRFAPLSGPLDALAVLRFAASPNGEAVFVDRPNILVQHSTLVKAPETGDFFARFALDIVENGVGVDPRAAVDPWLARLIQGVTDTNAEALVVRDLPGGVNAAALFAADAAREVAWQAIEPGDPVGIALSGASPDLAGRIVIDLSRGYSVVAPNGGAAAPTPPVWWRIDPATGTTLGMGPNGWGASLVEYAFVITLQTLMAQIACMAGSAAIDAAMSAVEKGKVEVPTWEKAKESASSLAKSCISQALLFTLTGYTNAYFLKKFQGSRFYPSSMKPGGSANPNKASFQPGSGGSKTKAGGKTGGSKTSGGKTAGGKTGSTAGSAGSGSKAGGGGKTGSGSKAGGGKTGGNKSAESGSTKSKSSSSEGKRPAESKTGENKAPPKNTSETRKKWEEKAKEARDAQDRAAKAKIEAKNDPTNPAKKAEAEAAQREANRKIKEAGEAYSDHRKAEAAEKGADKVASKSSTNDGGGKKSDSSGSNSGEKKPGEGEPGRKPTQDELDAAQRKRDETLKDFKDAQQKAAKAKLEAKENPAKKADAEAAQREVNQKYKEMQKAHQENERLKAGQRNEGGGSAAQSSAGGSKPAGSKAPAEDIGTAKTQPQRQAGEDIGTAKTQPQKAQPGGNDTGTAKTQPQRQAGEDAGTAKTQPQRQAGEDVGTAKTQPQKAQPGEASGEAGQRVPNHPTDAQVRDALAREKKALGEYEQAQKRYNELEGKQVPPDRALQHERDVQQARQHAEQKLREANDASGDAYRHISRNAKGDQGKLTQWGNERDSYLKPPPSSLGSGAGGDIGTAKTQPPPQRQAGEDIGTAKTQPQRQAGEDIGTAKTQPQRQAGEDIGTAKTQPQRQAGEDIGTAKT
ncbi:MAG: hypothetical protein AB7G46_09530, partial [Alphaproteobacteria bacterium]